MSVKLFFAVYEQCIKTDISIEYIVFIENFLSFSFVYDIHLSKCAFTYELAFKTITNIKEIYYETRNRYKLTIPIQVSISP